MISNNVTQEAHEALLKSKHDKSVVRYLAGWPHVVDRYNITAALVQGPRVLDVGCGECLLARLLLENHIINGVDACGEMVEKAKAFVGEYASIQIGYAECLPYEDGEFDTVVLGQTLEHVRNVSKAIKEALRVLKVGGRVIVNVPADDVVPHGNHLHVFESAKDMMLQFDHRIQWEGWGTIHNYYNAWGKKK
jgi:ubiquinone/menaquinone biosynthesis C-methylase UbiE